MNMKNILKKTWSIINELTSRKQKRCQIDEIHLNGSIISDSHKMALELSNEYDHLSLLRRHCSLFSIL